MVQMHASRIARWWHRTWYGHERTLGNWIDDGDCGTCVQGIRGDERGAVAVFTALCLVLLIGAVALTVDIGGLLLRRREMVNGTDAAALASAITYLDTGGMVGPAQAKSDELFVENTPGSVKNGWSRVSWTLEPGSTLQQGSITVVYTSQQPMFFAPAIGFDDERPVTTKATASWKADGVLGEGTFYEDDPLARKVYVCKYVAGGNGQPEALQTGNNPIEIARNSTHPYPVGEWFVDNQQWSYVLAPITADPPPTIEDCPQPGPHVWLSE